jgi:hypothetical protein
VVIAVIFWWVLLALWVHNILAKVDRNYGWVFGLFFGLVGVIIAYIIKAEVKIGKITN